jgi:hypothetical protein
MISIKNLHYVTTEKHSYHTYILPQHVFFLLLLFSLPTHIATLYTRLGTGAWINILKHINRECINNGKYQMKKNLTLFLQTRNCDY